MYIEKPIVYDPNNDPVNEKKRIVDYAYETMVDSYILHELSSNVKIKHKK